MAKRTPKQHNPKRTSPVVSGASARTPPSATARPAATDPAHPISGVGFQPMVFAVAFLIVCSRRPDALLQAQFYAEDGAVFYTAAYQFGLHSLLIPYGGYLHTLLRLTALLAQLFPLAIAPLVMNLVGITVQVLPVNLFLSSRFSSIAFPIRLLAGFLYLALPNAFEIHVSVTNVQWHLALLACLALLAQPAVSSGWRGFDATVLVLTALSSPMAILLVPMAAVLWWKRRDRCSATSLALLAPGAAVQALIVLLHWHSRQQPHLNLAGGAVFNGGPIGANLARFASILGRQVFLSSLLGLNTQGWLLESDYVSVVEVIATVLGLALLVYTLRYANTELRLFLIFAFAVLALGLINPLAGPPDRPQWEWLCIPGCGNRYYFLPMLAFLASLLWMASHSPVPRALRCFAVALLLLLPIGIYQDWEYPPFQDFQFKRYAGQFERAAAGTKLAIPINPGWTMELTKH